MTVCLEGAYLPVSAPIDPYTEPFFDVGNILTGGSLAGEERQ
jgi:hypothetical protein